MVEVPRRTLFRAVGALAVGQRVMRIFRLAAFDRPRDITLVLDDGPARRFFGDLAGTYEVLPRGDASRIVVKLVVGHPGRPFGWTLKALAEASS
jgi:hypothetical protein